MSLAENVDYLRRLRALNGFADLVPHARNMRSFVRSPLVEVGRFGSNPGNLRMFAYVPGSLQYSRALVVVLHGCGQSAANYELGAGWSTLAKRYGFALLVPEQQLSNNANTCFNWFSPDDIARGRLVPLLTDWSSEHQSYYLYYPGRRQLPVPLKLFSEFLQAGLKD